MQIQILYLCWGEVQRLATLENAKKVVRLQPNLSLSHLKIMLDKRT